MIERSEDRTLSVSLEPLDDWLVVEPGDAESWTRGGLIIPAGADQPCRSGIVTAVGPDSGTVELGDKVLFAKDAGFEVRVGPATFVSSAVSTSSPEFTTSRSRKLRFRPRSGLTRADARDRQRPRRARSSRPLAFERAPDGACSPAPVGWGSSRFAPTGMRPSAFDPGRRRLVPCRRFPSFRGSVAWGTLPAPRRSGRVAEGGALLRRYGGKYLHRGFESLLLRRSARTLPRRRRPLKLSRAAAGRCARARGR